MGRSYNEYCGLARALDVVGERWTLLIVRNLLLGPQRYGELQTGLPGITTNLLAARLKHLVAHEVIEPVDLAHGVSGYALTDRGRSLEPALLALGRFGQRDLAGGPRPDDHVDIGWGMVSMKRRYRGTRRGTAQIVVTDGPRFHMDYGPDRVAVTRGEGPSELTLRGPLSAIQRVLFMGAGPSELERDGAWCPFARSFGLAE